MSNQIELIVSHGSSLYPARCRAGASTAGPQGDAHVGGLMILVGVAFKLSAVPFHFWCPDVFEGASAEVDAFLSVASKAAAMALLIRVAH
jgi:NADH:ubiquinone oxidoreductase subunit 2 (subunit N)